MKPGAPVVNETYPKNTFTYHDIYDHQKLRFGDVERGFAAADHILEQRYQMSPIEHAPTETNGSIAAPDTNGRYVVYTSTQALFFSLDTCAKILDVPSNKLHFIGGTVGGGFGGKVDTVTEPLAILGAMLTGRPVRYIIGREEEMQYCAPRGAERIFIKDGVSRDGRILARKFRCLFDSGAYTRLSSYAVVKCAAHLPGPYTIPNVSADIYCVFTNRVPATAMRGFGVTAVDFAIECQMDKLAHLVGMDPMEFRLLNAYRDGDMKAHRREAKNTALIECVQVAAEKAKWRIRDDFKRMSSRKDGGGARAVSAGDAAGAGPSSAARPRNRSARSTTVPPPPPPEPIRPPPPPPRPRRRRRTARCGSRRSSAPGGDEMAKLRGRGMASINYPIGMNLGGDPSQALVHSNPSGKFTVSLSSIDLGQGMKSVTRQICAETLGVPVEDVYVDTADSDTGPHCMGSFASRGTHRVGNAVMAAAREARGVMMEAAAEELEVNVADLETDGRGNIHVKGAPHRSISTKDVAIAAQFRQGRTISGRGIFLVPLSAVDPETGEMSPATCYAHACLVAEVEVDDETGEVAMVKMDSAYELGRALNPRLVEQQLVGGAWMGISHALYETTEPYYPDPSHGPRDFVEYLMPGPGDICPHDIAVLERPAPDGPFGAKGPGEMCANPVDAGGRQRDLQRRWRQDRRTADHAGKSAARDQGAGRRAAAGAALRLIDGGQGQHRRHRQPGSAREGAALGLLSRRRGPGDGGLSRLALGKPLLLEGAPGVGKTEAAKAVAAVLARRLIRLQCYEGIDASSALYEWNYPRQMLAIRQAGEQTIDIYGEPFLIERPMLAALRSPDSTVLLIDEIDRSDQEFEAFLLEFLSDFQISIPERGTIRAAERPVVILTSNRTRDLHEALRRRCVYHWIDYPNAEREARIVMLRASSVAEATARAVVAAVGKLRREPLSKAPGISEAVDWAEAATLLNRGGARWPDAFKRSIGVALKDEEDLAYVSGRLDAMIAESVA